ncbi:CLUMA_CG020074, isoform A [Clunio marinus]|uniref:CLUMA_CG020074, isoform A n=1 Tax=Clunio marinus TaxID=568069 RepID=A0A1J1J3L9_9DIPT|nr:CLUMA_CG020074, isoform A [Clunio marinus]
MFRDICNFQSKPTFIQSLYPIRAETAVKEKISFFPVQSTINREVGVFEKLQKWKRKVNPPPIQNRLNSCVDV